MFLKAFPEVSFFEKLLDTERKKYLCCRAQRLVRGISRKHDGGFQSGG
jgi:hypothetical protein